MKPLEWKTASSPGQLLHLESIREQCLSSMSQIDSLSNHKWHFFRTLLNPQDFVSREFAVNRAFYKLWEILSKYPLQRENSSSTKDEPITTLHLAEAPGSFVQVVKKMFPESKSVAVSKPPSLYAEVVQKGRSIPTFSKSVLSMKGCKFLYKDLLQHENISAYVKEILDDRNFVDGFSLITADGGFDEEERYDAKEVLHYNLILGEIIVILNTQKLHGQCVLKIFETFTDTSVYILYILCSCYETFDIVKPSTSRPTNAERYVVCKGFKGSPYKMEDLVFLLETNITKGCTLSLDIPDEFIRTISERAIESSKSQIAAIDKVMEFVKEKSAGRSGGVYIDKKQYTAQKKESYKEWKDTYNYTDY